MVKRWMAHILFLLFVTGIECIPRKFPSDFKFGVGTSAYQIEGAWTEDHKSESIWEHYIHSNPKVIADGSNADVACDSYHKYEEDVEMLKNLGVDHYRFSISWPRILPNGTANHVNQNGVQYYRNLIKLLKKNKIEPMVTLYHWDLPQVLQEQGGFASEKLVKWFTDYARLCFKLFGKDVKTWITFNEPKQICLFGYGLGVFAPALNKSGELDYLCAYNLLKAHAEAWHIYNNEFRPHQKGRISMVVEFSWHEPLLPDVPAFEEAAISNLEFMAGIYVNPLYRGDWPEIVKAKVAHNSRKEGKDRSRLPEFSTEEINQIKGTCDFLAVNFYTSFLVYPSVTPQPEMYSARDAGVSSYQPWYWEEAKSVWLKVTPWGFKRLLKYLKDTYDNPEIIITENGISDGGELDDDLRISYMQQHLNAILEAIWEYGVNVSGYTVWSLMDSFEWLDGYQSRFGLYHVDFSDPRRQRTMKASARYYKDIIKNRSLDKTSGYLTCSLE
ncbi:unnamed protein product [Acanthoscelides obtectus]|uniref:beta-glucosidase n=1 Tax=Acanthoscelides obtectus TaxID=200917 RepID=A0A9P0JMN7_ACAOB|nr:unnamed protein product [Acanthoscelides obtectus]CAK1661319.1 Cytosolic beta-glucosidase [Acanthoscelides obtectus]